MYILEQGQLLAILIIIVAICAIMTIYHFYLRFKSSTYSKDAKRALEELENLSLPSRFFTNEELVNYQNSKQELEKNIKSLYSSHFISDNLLDKKELRTFLIKLSEASEKKRQNNIVYNSIQTIRTEAQEISTVLQSLFNINHYFTHSELEKIQKDSECLMNALSVVYPNYVKYLAEGEMLAFYDDLNIRMLTIERLRNEHNKLFVDCQLIENRKYFDTVLGKYPLDEQQRDSIVKLEDNCLVTASAGSGKTSTILAKAKYLVEKRNIAPQKILLLTYTRKAAEELRERMKIDGLECNTFHGLAYKILSKVNNQVPSISENSLAQTVFYQLLKSDELFQKAINDYILNLQSLQGLEHEYNDAFSYFEDRKKYGIQALFPDMDGNIIYTRSEEEKRLCTILTKLGVNFRYEKPYEHETFTNEYRQYRPDFTIYWKDGENERHLYLEHFAIDSSGQVPKWFGDGREGGWYKANRAYIDGISWKRRTHAQYGTILIETTSADFHYGNVEQKLLSQLQRYGVPTNRRGDKEIYDLLVKRSKKVEKTVFTLILSFITLLKANEKNIDDLIEEAQKTKSTDMDDGRNLTILCTIMKPFLNKYQEALEARGEMDFTDCIIKATDICRKGFWKKNYEYILVDEFQDISVDRYKFLQALRSKQPLTKLFCVGDDWQSIFRFAGSDMSLFYEFEKFFGYTEQCKIETTYRFHQPVIDRSSEFIQKNPQQKPKTITPPKGDTLSTNLVFVTCEDKDDVLKQVEKIISFIPVSETILLMGRYNYDAYSVGYRNPMGNNENVVTVNISGKQVRFLSIHSAKGLEADHVILINCNQGAYGFPSLIEDDPILDFVLSQSETFPYAEERRLFYVAMTRAKKRAYVLYDKSKPSPFVLEFEPRFNQGDYLCPLCMEGKVIVQKQSVASNGTPYKVYTCSNYDGGCDFFERKFGEHEHPGTFIEATTTVKDIEIIREKKRRRMGKISHGELTSIDFPKMPPMAKCEDDPKADLPF